MARQIRDSKVPREEFLRPFDVTKFGSPDDPCFGKLYSLNEDECLACGDHEICSIVFMNASSTKRIKWEKENPALDVEIDKLELAKDIKEFQERLRAKGFKPLLIKRRTNERFHITN